MSLPLRRIAVVAAVALLALPCAGAFAAPQLFKCVEGGRTVYQQQACRVSAESEAASGAATRAAPPVADAASAAPRKLKSSSPASSAHATRR